MLDPTMMYSCGVFERPGRDARGGVAGQARAGLRQARPRPATTTCSRSARGWGGFAVHAAATRGCRVTTTTISREQHDLAVRAGPRGRPRATASTVAARRLPRPARQLRQARLDRDDRGRRLARLRHVLRRAARSCCAPTARCCCRRSRSTTAPTRSRRRRSSFIRTYVFPNGCLPSHRGHRALRRAADRHAHGRTSRTSPRTTPRRCAAGGRTSSAAAERARGARLRRALPAAVADVPRLLRGRVRRAPHRRRADACWPSRAGAASVRRGRDRAAAAIAHGRGCRLNIRAVTASSRTAGAARGELRQRRACRRGSSIASPASIASTTFAAHAAGSTRSQPEVSDVAAVHASVASSMSVLTPGRDEVQDRRRRCPAARGAATR